VYDEKITTRVVTVNGILTSDRKNLTSMCGLKRTKSVENSISNGDASDVQSFGADTLQANDISEFETKKLKENNEFN
jgi:hypothetical protein